MDYYKRALALKAEIISNRRHFHQHPEVGLWMLETQANAYGGKVQLLRFAIGIPAMPTRPETP